MPDNWLTRFIRSLFNHDYRPEREGNNVPLYMLSRKKRETGFFFGVKRRGWWDDYVTYVGKPLNVDGHIIGVGGAGTGKSACIAKNVLETWDAPIFAIDIKGELSEYYIKFQKNKIGIPAEDYSEDEEDLPLKEVYANRERELLKNCIVFDPTNKGGYGYDPFYFLRTGGEEYLSQNAREIALSILQAPVGLKDRFWIETAQSIFTGAILYYFGIGANFRETMIAFQTKDVDELIKDIMESDNTAAKSFVIHARKAKPETLAGVAMEISNKISVFVTDPFISTAMCDSKEDTNYFNWSDLEEKHIFLKLPEDKLEQWESALALMINQLIRTLERRADRHSEQGKKLSPILILLDEFPRLGKVEAIKNALATLRSKNVTICLMVQSIAQLDDIYGDKSRRVIFDNCAYKAILSVSERDNQRYISDLIGSCEIDKISHGVQYDSGEGIEVGYGTHTSKHREPIIFPHDLAKLNDIVLITPKGYCRVNKHFAKIVEEKDERYYRRQARRRKIQEEIDKRAVERRQLENKILRINLWRFIRISRSKNGFRTADGGNYNFWNPIRRVIEKIGNFLKERKKEQSRIKRLKQREQENKKRKKPTQPKSKRKKL